MIQNAAYSSTKQLGLIRDLMKNGPSVTILFLYIYLNYNSKILEEIIQKIIIHAKSARLKNTQTLATDSKPSIWKPFPSFCKLILVLSLLISCLENFAYSYRSIDCNTIATHNYSNNVYWHGRNMACFREQPVYRTLLAIVLFLFGRYTLLLWAFADILSIVLCHAMKNLFLGFNDDLEQMFMRNRLLMRIDIPTWWNQIREKYFRFVELFERMTKFIYPLILSCYWINI